MNMSQSAIIRVFDVQAKKIKQATTHKERMKIAEQTTRVLQGKEKNDAQV